MALPPALRYRLVRIQSLGRSLNRLRVWGGLGLVGLLAVAVSQYWRNPEWRSQYNPAVDSAAVDPSTNVGTLSSEELADLAEIDNLALLLNQLQPTTATALKESVPSANTDSLALPTATEDQQTPAGPFAEYLERSRFRVSSAASDREAGFADGAFTVGQSPASASAPSPEERQPSALQQALNQRFGAQAGQLSEAEGTQGAEAIANPDAPPPWMVEGSLPGVDQRFIRTTPQMSPPPGTTGYTPPPGLAPSPAAATAATPAALNLNFGTPAAIPSGGVTVQPPAAAPSNSLSSPPQPEPAPFSAPRPPGVYTGNGYINTFSDPSGPAN